MQQEPYFERYSDRHWAVYDGTGGLVAVTVYKKGAAEVVKRLKPLQNDREDCHVEQT